MTVDGFGHVLDMLGHCNSFGAVTISGMGPSSATVRVTVADGEQSMAKDGPTLTIALERMIRALERARRQCAECGAPLYGSIRVHHHGENGQDVTTRLDATQYAARAERHRRLHMTPAHWCPVCVTLGRVAGVTA